MKNSIFLKIMLEHYNTQAALCWGAKSCKIYGHSDLCSNVLACTVCMYIHMCVYVRCMQQCKKNIKNLIKETLKGTKSISCKL